MINNDFRAALLLPLVLLISCQKAPPGPPEYQGTVEFEETALSFELPGKVESVLVRRGDVIRTEQLLATIGHSLEQKLVDARAAEEQAAVSQRELLEVGARPAQIRALRSVVKAAEANLSQQKRQYEREKALLQKGITTDERVEQLEASVAMADASLEQRRAELKNLELGSRKQEIAGAKSKVEALEIQTSAERERLERYTLKSPLDGEVLDVHVDPGEVVAAGLPVVTVARLDQPFVEVFVPQQQLANIALHTPAKVWLDADMAPFDGTVTFIAKKTEFTPRYLFSETERSKLVVRVRIELKDPGHKVHAGVPARARFLHGG